MKTVEIHYGVVFGKGDSSDWIDWELELTDEEAAIYDEAIRNETLLNDIPELQEALQRAYEEIEEEEIQNGIDMEDEYVLECQGLAEMDTDELTELVRNRDPHALKFFGLTDASDDEINDWDAEDLDEIPTIAEFNPNFEPYSPYDEGWRLVVEYVDLNE